MDYLCHLRVEKEFAPLPQIKILVPTEVPIKILYDSLCQMYVREPCPGMTKSRLVSLIS